MPQIPRDPLPDSTLALVRDPYRFISKRCERYRSDLFESTLMLERTICLRGRAAAELFYSPRFARSGVAPGWLEKTLFGRGGVQGLDDEAHRHRKAMFVSLMTPERISDLADAAADEFNRRAEMWVGRDRVVLYPELHEILNLAVCAWAGVPLPEPETERRTRQLTAMFDQAAAFGLGHFRSRRARRRAERWIEEVIEAIRADRLKLAEHDAAHVIAWFRERDGDLLDRHTAAVELINVLRPTVAISVYATFAALALHQYPACRERLAAGEPEYAEHFAQEVRRFYPFFPIVMARTLHDFEWEGYHFPGGTKTALDLYGTNHDERLWERPGEFRPDRFRNWDGDPFNFIPQGGGDPNRHHRCPGEAIAVALIKVAADFLATRTDYAVPAQDLCIDFARLPALPRSRFVIRNVRLNG